MLFQCFLLQIFNYFVTAMDTSVFLFIVYVLHNLGLLGISYFNLLSKVCWQCL